MIHPIVLYDSNTLRQMSAPINIETVNRADTRELIDDMFETMHRANGIGLSAIQIGIPHRIFIAEAHLEEEDFDLRETFINPRIISESNETMHYTEGCLSIPSVAAGVTRPENIEIEYYNYNFEKVTKKFDKFACRIIQHEMDHLNGVLFIDNLKHMYKTMIADSLEDIKNGNKKPNYLFKLK